MRSSQIDFGMVTISLTDFRPLEVFLEDIPRGRVSEYLLASAYFPAFKSEKINGKYYLDGGLYNNLPVDL